MATLVRGSLASPPDGKVLVRLAVIGSGISGIGAATLLSGRGHEVTVFEALPRLGGHTNTVRLELDGEIHAVDTGFIVHNRRNYPVFCGLLDDWGVATQESEMSFSVSCAQTGLEYAGTGLSGLFAQRTNLVRPQFGRLLAEIVRFARIGRRLLAESDRSGSADGPSVTEFLAQYRFAPIFSDHYLLPLGSAVWSTDPGGFGAFPVIALLRFLDNHGLLTLVNRPQWRTIAGGSQRYLEAAVSKGNFAVRLSTAVQAVRRDNALVDIILEGSTETFDGVVIAVHSDQALRMLADPTPAEQSVLGAIPYRRNEAALHTDARMLPRSPRAWAAWNYHRSEHDTGLPTVTYWMNRLQRLTTRQPICVTLNRTEEIDPAHLHQVIEYHHPVYHHATFAAQRRWSEVNGVNRTWYCGAWWGYGFHEDGAASAARVADAIGVAR